MKILVTGHKGFLGSNFVNQYGKLYDVVGFDHKDGDELLDYGRLKEGMNGVEQVVHLAAIPKPVEGKTLDDYFRTNVEGTHNILKASLETNVKRVIYASSTTIYGIERGIPFTIPIKENQPFISQYIDSSDLSCRDVDLSYHMSKVMAEQLLAWYGLNKKVETVALRFGPIGKVFLGTSVSVANATRAIHLALSSTRKFWYEAFSIVDELPHIDISKARTLLGYKPEKPNYPKDHIHSTISDRTLLKHGKS